MIDFDELNKNDLGYNGVPTYEKGFEAGQQSQQAKIDALKKQLSRLGYTDNGAELMKPPLGKTPDFGIVSIQRDKIDELQARFDGARSHVDHIYNVLGDDPDLAKLLDEMVEILKGNKDD